MLALDSIWIFRLYVPSFLEDMRGSLGSSKNIRDRLILNCFSFEGLLKNLPVLFEGLDFILKGK